MRRAFTILEMLAATALTALLMVVVLHVVGTLAAGRAKARANPAADVAQRLTVLDVLRRDLSEASAASFEPGGMTLTSHLSLAPATLAAQHEPVTVTYAVATIARHRWLVRRQQSRVAKDRPVTTELICPDVVAFSPRPMGFGASLTGAPLSAPAPTSQVIALHLEFTNGRVIDETVVTR